MTSPIFLDNSDRVLTLGRRYALAQMLAQEAETIGRLYDGPDWVWLHESLRNVRHFIGSAIYSGEESIGASVLNSRNLNH